MESRAVSAQPPYLVPLFEAGQMLTVQEMARALKLNPQTLYRLVRQGLVPAVRIGKKTLRFDPAQVQATLKAKEPRRPSAKERKLTAPALTFTRLEDLRAAGGWLTPASNLALERFAVRLPPGADISSLAYDRTGR